MDIDDTTYLASSNTFISENKGVLDGVGEFGPSAFGDAGGKLTMAAAAMSATGFGAPAGAFTALVGSALSLIGSFLQVANDLAEDEFGFKTIRTIGSEVLSRKLNVPENDFGQTGEIMNDVLINQINDQIDKLEKAQ